MTKMAIFISFSLHLILLSCTAPDPNVTSIYLSPDEEARLKEFWYDGKGEINSYQLQQARYGEMRNGTATLIFVTEDFSTKTMTKADQSASANISVLKLNTVKKFNTGIYPYSMMTSTFFPFPQGNNSVKISTSSQEWCGHTYLELIDKGAFEITRHSYFQTESESDLKLNKALLEDDIWTKIRLTPNELPQGKFEVIPSFMFLRLSHQEIKPYTCQLSLDQSADSIAQYEVAYPELDRTLVIQFSTEFPYPILGWEETYPEGWGENRKVLTTSATLIKSMRTDYWTKNHNNDGYLRSELGLD